MHLTLESYLFLKQGQEIRLLQLGISGNLKHCRHPIDVMGVVDTFGQALLQDNSKMLHNTVHSVYGQAKKPLTLTYIQWI